MTCIETYMLQPTNTLGRRIVAVASVSRQRIVIPVCSHWTDRTAHLNAAQAMAYQYGWKGSWILGDGRRGPVWVWAGFNRLPEPSPESFYVAEI